MTPLVRFGLVSLLCGLASQSFGADQYWDTSAGGGLQPGAGTWDAGISSFWNSDAAGSGALAPWTAGNDAFFQTGGTDTITVSGTVEANSLNFSLAEVATFSGTTTPSLRIGAGGMNVASTSGAITLGSTLPVRLTADQTWTQNSSSLLTVAGGLTNAAPLTLTFAGSGTTRLSANNVSSGFSGGVTILSGKLEAVTNNSLGSGLITLGDTGGANNARLAVQFNNNTTANDIQVRAGTTGALTLEAGPAGGSVQSGTFSGDVQLDNNLTLFMNRSARTLTMSGVITGSSTLNITGLAGDSVVSLTNAGNGTAFTGDVTLSSGRLRFSSNALGNGVTGQGDGSITFLSSSATLEWAAGNTQDLSGKTISAGAGITGNLNVGANTVSFGAANGLTGAGNFRLFASDNAGVLSLNASNNYTGSTIVTRGTLIAGVNVPSGAAGAFGNATSAIALGDTDSDPGYAAAILTGGAVTIGRAINIGNRATVAYTLGGSTDNSSTFSGLITTPRDVTISQVATTGANALHITGGITGSTSNTKTVTFAGPGSILVQSAISTGTGTLSVAVSGGRTTFSAASTYNGGTLVNAGTLLVDNTTGSGTGTGAVSVAANAELGGSGSIGGTLTVSGSITPGNNGIESLTVDNSVTWNGQLGQDWKFELGLVSGSNDQLLLTGASGDLFKGSGSVFRFDFLGTGTVGTFTLLDWSGTTTFAETDFSYIGLDGGLTGTFAFNGSQLDLTVVPEPSVSFLLALGACSIPVFRRRR